MGKPFFSVIVPAHNSENYLDRCLQSVIDQMLTDYELIVVCDACTDRTATVARKFTDKVIITNFGMDGLARNAGIDAAEGEWLLFLDDDDWWIHEFVLDEIHKAAEALGDKVDLIPFDFIWKGMGYFINQPQRMNIAVWSKAFRREFVGDIRFPAVPFTSDEPFMDEICKKKPRCYPLRRLMYYYNYMRKGSQTELNEKEGKS